jgi:glycosyltransferase involved in cell wall biosynthesis
MISVVIATHESENALVMTLAALVPGALAGLVREVIVADGGSRDGTETVADVTGARFVVSDAPLGARLKGATALARGQWLLFLRPGMVPDVTWIDDVRSFLRDRQADEPVNSSVAVFRPLSAAGHRRALVADVFALVASSFGARPGPRQGLLIAKDHYDALGGHRADAADPEAELLQRIGGRTIVTLRSGVATAAV